MEDNEALKRQLLLIKENQDSFLYAHSYMICLFLSKIISKFEWESDTIKESFAYLSFFHDISLLDDTWAMYQSQEELDSKNLNPGLKEHIAKHANESALLIEKIPNIPTGITQAIREHHGAKDGIGFADQLKGSLHPLAMIFMVIEEFVVKFLALENPTTDDLITLVNDLEKKYYKGNYQKAVEALKSVVFKKVG